MDNPTQYLRTFIRKNYPGVESSPVIGKFGERTAECWINTKLSTGRWSFKIFIPRSAPENGRPLCTVVMQDNRKVWSFEENHKLYQGVRQKLRVHLHQFSLSGSRQFALVKVLEGDPDKLTRVYRIDGNVFPIEIEALWKAHLARLWGMKLQTNAAEKSALDRLMQPRKK